MLASAAAASGPGSSLPVAKKTRSGITICTTGVAAGEPQAPGDADVISVPDASSASADASRANWLSSETSASGCAEVGDPYTRYGDGVAHPMGSSSVAGIASFTARASQGVQ